MNITQAELDALLARRGKPQAAVVSEPPPARNKYGAKRTEYAGRRYDSKAEAEHAMKLDLRVKAGDLLGWVSQPTIIVCLLKDDPGMGWRWRPHRSGKNKRLMPLYPGEAERLVLQCRLDFLVTDSLGRLELHEVKGYRVRDWPLRERILRLAGVPLVVIR